LGTNEASRTYGVPKSTLSQHMTGEKNKITTGDVKFHGYERALPNDWEAESDTKIDVFWTEV